MEKNISLVAAEAAVREIFPAPPTPNDIVERADLLDGSDFSLWGESAEREPS